MLSQLKNSFPFAEIPQGSASNNSVRFWNKQAHSNSSWSNDRGPLWRWHPREVAKSPPSKTHTSLGPNNPHRNDQLDTWNPHSGPPPRWDPCARERRKRQRMVHIKIQPKRTHMDQKNISLPEQSTAGEPMVPWPYVPPPIQQQQQPQKQQTVDAPPEPSLEELVRQMTIQNM